MLPQMNPLYITNFITPASYVSVGMSNATGIT